MVYINKLFNKNIDKISLFLLLFNFLAFFINTKYGSLYSYFFKNYDGIVSSFVFILCYILNKKKNSKYSTITLKILKFLIIIIFFMCIFVFISNIVYNL